MLCDPAALGRGGPKDLKEQATRFRKDSVELVADKDAVGKCGEHSKRSSWASGLYDQYVSVVDVKSGGIRQEHLWLCGHLTSYRRSDGALRPPTRRASCGPSRRSWTNPP